MRYRPSCSSSSSVCANGWGSPCCPPDVIATVPSSSATTTGGPWPFADVQGEAHTFHVVVGHDRFTGHLLEEPGEPRATGDRRCQLGVARGKRLGLGAQAGDEIACDLERRLAVELRGDVVRGHDGHLGKLRHVRNRPGRSLARPRGDAGEDDERGERHRACKDDSRRPRPVQARYAVHPSAKG